MLTVLHNLKTFLNQNCTALINGYFVPIQRIGIIKHGDEPKLIITEGSLRNHLITNSNYNTIELGDYVKTEDVILELDYNKIHLLINVLENMKALGLTQVQWSELTTLMSKTKY